MHEIGIGKVEISVFNPLNSICAIDNPKINSLAKTVSKKLKKVVDSL